MVEHDHDRDAGERGVLEGNENFGTLLRRLRGELSLRDVNRLSGVSSYHRQNLSGGAKEHRALHETYQIICETLCEQATGSSLKGKVCRQADRFAAAALMQPEGALIMAQTSGAGPAGPPTGLPLVIRLGDAVPCGGSERIPADGSPVRSRPR